MLVEAARGRLAELEAGFTVEKAQVEAMKARLFVRLRAHFQRRDQLRDIITGATPESCHHDIGLVKLVLQKFCQHSAVVEMMERRVMMC